VQFIDTDVLPYAISRDPAEQDKAKRANDILADRDLALSVQVLQEFYLQATRASRPDPITHQQAVRLIGSFRRFPCPGRHERAPDGGPGHVSAVPALVLGRRDHRSIPRDGLRGSPVRRSG